MEFINFYGFAWYRTWNYWKLERLWAWRKCCRYQRQLIWSFNWTRCIWVCCKIWERKLEPLALRFWSSQFICRALCLLWWWSKIWDLRRTNDNFWIPTSDKYGIPTWIWRLISDITSFNCKFYVKFVFFVNCSINIVIILLKIKFCEPTLSWILNVSTIWKV